MSSASEDIFLLDLQSEILEQVACGEPVRGVADLVCRRVEAFDPEVICSILSVEDGRLHPLAGPSLPRHFSDAVDGIEIGPVCGSCGTAAWRNEPVEVTDIESDPLWADFKALALSIGLRACWSSPIRARDGRVIGTFALYYRTPRAPNEPERRIVQKCAHLCAISIEQHAIRAQSHRLAYCDLLTGLPNRASFGMGMQGMLAASCPHFGLLLVDLDQFKATNDTLGHAAGDTLLRAVGQRLGAALPNGRAFRLGGDEFAMILDGIVDCAGLSACAAAVIRAVTQPVEHDGHMLAPSVTLGGVICGVHGHDADTLTQNADFALYHGKESNRGGFVPFQEGMRTAIIRRIQTIRDVDAAIGENRIFPWYQPIVRLDTAEIVGLEALVRMRAPDGRIVSAGEFHQAMTDHRVAHAMTGQMLEQIAVDLRRWLDLGIPFQHVGINVTTGDFLKGDLEERMTAIFARHGVPLKHAILEVNESVFTGAGDNAVARAVKGLRAKGLRVALDDFGTGFASLTNLLNFPVDILKIDKSFVDRLNEDKKSLAIVEALMELSRKLDMRIVAEGIETGAQAECLLSLGCSLGQGFYYSRPVDAAMTTELLKRFGQYAGTSRNHHDAPMPLRA